MLVALPSHHRYVYSQRASLLPSPSAAWVDSGQETRPSAGLRWLSEPAAEVSPLGLPVVRTEPDLGRWGVVVDEHGVPGRKCSQLTDRRQPLPLVRFRARWTGRSLRQRGADRVAFADEVGEDLEKVGIGHAGEQDTGNVVVENRPSVVSPPSSDDLSVVLEDGDQLHVAGAQGGGVLGQLGERSRVGRLVEQQEEWLVGSLLLLDTLPDPDDQRVDQPYEDNDGGIEIRRTARSEVRYWDRDENRRTRML